MTESRTAEKTYVWQAEKPLHMGRYHEIHKGQTFQPSRRMVTAFGDLMATESAAKAKEEDAAADTKAQEEKAKREADRAAKAEAEATQAAEAAAEPPRYSSAAQPKRSSTTSTRGE